MNIKSRLFYIVVIALVFSAGILVGLLLADFNIIKWSPEFKIGDMIAMVTAGLTFIYAYKSFENSRLHNELANKPRLVDHLSTSKLKLNFSWKIENVGLGAALECRYSYLFEGKEINASSLDSKLKKQANDETSIFSLSEPKAIRAGDSAILIQFQAKSAEQYNKLLKFVHEKVLLELDYKDVYGNTMKDTFTRADKEGDDPK